VTLPRIEGCDYPFTTHAFEALANQIERIVHPVENVVAMTR
jgi:hypothetical protein